MTWPPRAASTSCWSSPDRLARKFAYQALLIEELARCGTRVEFVKGPRGDSPEDQLLVQFQGMFAEYEKAQLMERYRRGKAWRAKAGAVNVLSGAPFGYRYVRKTPETGARYEVVPHEAALVTEMFRRYADDGAAIADLRRWLTAEGVRTRTGKERWDRSVIGGMLRNPAYAGTAVFAKTRAIPEPAGLNRTARLAGRTVPRQVRVQDRPREEWTGIPVPGHTPCEGPGHRPPGCRDTCAGPGGVRRLRCAEQHRPSGRAEGVPPGFPAAHLAAGPPAAHRHPQRPARRDPGAVRLGRRPPAHVPGWEEALQRPFANLDETGDELAVRVRDVLAPSGKISYTYDLGACWEHEITLEKLMPRDPGQDYPVCVAYKGDSPVEYWSEDDLEEPEPFNQAEVNRKLAALGEVGE